MAATRKCPDDWIPPDSLHEWQKKNCPDVNYWKELEAFKDYTFPSSKSDWTATARNWLRKAQERATPKYKQEAPLPIRSTYVAPPEIDRFTRCANKVFLHAVMQTKGLPRELVVKWQRRAKELSRDFRLLDKDKQDVNNFPVVVRQEFRRLYAEHQKCGKG